MMNNINHYSNRLAFDMSGLHHLKQQAINGSADNIKHVAQQFETLFINMMMQSMRKAVPEGGLFNSSATQMFTSMFDQQVAQQAAGNGLGLADMLTKQLTASTSSNTSQSKSPHALQITANQAPTSYSLAESLFTDSTNVSVKNLGQVLYHNLANQPFIQPTDNSLTTSYSPAQHNDNNVAQFINQWLDPAIKAAKQTGIPYQVIIAQAALETGWGQKQITTDDGKPSYNYFAIKAGSTWQGKTTQITTSEYTKDEKIKTIQHFRVYDNLRQAVEDYVRLLSQNPRYQMVTQAPTAKDAAIALQQANYATDPNYADKLIQLIDKIETMIKSIRLPQAAGFMPIKI